MQLGGMALRDGVLLQSDGYWAAAVREEDGGVKVVSGAKPQLPARETLRQVPVVRGLVRLGEAMAEGAGRKAGVPLVLMADQRVSHGTITRIVNMARAAGFHEVNIAAREPAPVFIRDDTKRP